MTAVSVTNPPAAVPARSAWRLGFASAAVMLAAADTYVVVLALPSIMADVGLSIDHLEKATPIVSGFLLGYVALLPLLGRLSDISGRAPVFAGCLVAFGFGSLITASAHGLTTTVIGRTLQGAGGGGMVPVTLAIVADLWPPGRRGLPLGVVGAVQELGAVIGPLYGAAIISVSTWRTIFWLNLPLAALLGGGFLLARPRRAGPRRTGRDDLVGIGLGLVLVLSAGLAISAPSALADSVLWGTLYLPLLGDSAWTTPLALTALTSGLGFSLWETLTPASAPRVLPLRRLPEIWRRADGLGALLLAVLLGCIVLSFSTADPSRELLAADAVVLLPVGGLALGLFLLLERGAAQALVPLRQLTNPAAAGAILANLAIGAGLIAALVDIPFFARSTAYPDSQLSAALVLLRLLVAVPIGAVIGGFVCERIGYRITTLAGMVLATAAFGVMAGWGADAIGSGFRASDPILFGCGLGFGLAIAPVNAAILGAVSAALHGLAAALVVVARMVGMLVGISLLTAIGLRRFYADAATIPLPDRLCPSHPLSCPAYDNLARTALIGELHTIFIGAAVCTGLAGLLGVALLRRRRHRAGVPLAAVPGG